MSKFHEIAAQSAAVKYGQRPSVMWFHRLKAAGPAFWIFAVTGGLGILAALKGEPVVREVQSWSMPSGVGVLVAAAIIITVMVIIKHTVFPSRRVAMRRATRRYGRRF